MGVKHGLQDLGIKKIGELHEKLYAGTGIWGFGVKYKYYNLIIGPIENFNYVRNSVYLSISQKLGDMKMECRSSSALDKADTMQITSLS